MSEQKHIVMTGVSSGIGAALTEALSTDGHILYVCARRANRLKEVTRNNTIAFGRPCDVSDEQQVIEFANWVIAQTPRVDALINCAGSLGAIGPLVETDSHEWLKTIEVNLYGIYLMVRHFVPLLLRGHNPRIINFSGGGAFEPFPNHTAYAVSKAGVVRLTETLAIELAPKGIYVNAVAPGFVATEIHQATLDIGPAKSGQEYFEDTVRLMREGSVPMAVPVGCVRFLLSDKAAGLTGKALSARYDPWDTPQFVDLIPQLNQSDLYTLRRINLINTPDVTLRNVLSSSLQCVGRAKP